MLPKQHFYEAQAQTIIRNLEKRNMKGSYFHTAKEAYDYAMELIPNGASVSFGGTQTLEEMGMKQAFRNRADIQLYMRLPDMSYEEADTIYAKAFSADYYFMSTNGITMEGELFNIDGWGNRVACLIYGPKHVIVLAGMNKVAPNLDACIARARNVAAPANCFRLDKHTPCTQTGKCSNCLSPETICSQFVYTRHSAIPGRIHVLLVGEELGY